MEGMMTVRKLCVQIIVIAGVASAELSEGSNELLRRTNETDRPFPLATKFGDSVTDEECLTRDTTAELEDILAGKKLPYVFTGPSADCDTLGCQHGYWGRRGRFDGFFAPACPEADRWKMTSWLSQHAAQGAQWARDVLTLKPCDLWSELRGRTVWVLGDSVSQDVAYALAAFLVEYLSDEGQAIADDPKTMRALTHSQSGHELSSWCFTMVQGTRICSLRANKALRMASTVLKLMTSIADRDNDVVIMNFGIWYNAGVDGMAELDEDMPAFEATLISLLDELPKRLLWRETTAQHFDTPSGMFDPTKEIPEQRCAPPGAQLGVQVEMLPDGSLAATGLPKDNDELQVMLSGGLRNRRTQPAIDRQGIETLRLWNISLAVHDVHKNYHRLDSGGSCVTVDCDCSHACLPSWYEMILPQFLGFLRRWGQG